jgi:hypothetical protein
MARIQQFGGGAAGVGGTLAARQLLDEPGQNRLTQPSVLYGLGTGALASVLWFTDIETPVLADEFWASHAMTSIPAGLFNAVFPKQSGTSSVEQVREALRNLNGGSSGGSGSSRTESQRASIEASGSSASNGRRR